MSEDGFSNVSKKKGKRKNGDPKIRVLLHQFLRQKSLLLLLLFRRFHQHLPQSFVQLLLLSALPLQHTTRLLVHHPPPQPSPQLLQLLPFCGSIQHSRPVTTTSYNTTPADSTLCPTEKVIQDLRRESARLYIQLEKKVNKDVG